MSPKTKRNEFAIARTALIVVVIVIIIVAAAGAFYLASAPPTSSTSSVSTSSFSTTSSSQSSIETSAFSSTQTSSGSTQTISSSSLASSSASSSSASQSSSTSGNNSSTLQTLSIDSWSWPYPQDLNVIQANLYPWPNWLAYTVYQTLVTVNESALWNSGNIQFLPGLASNWTTSSDAKTYSFNLRNNVTFSNGDPFNAYQVWMEFYALYFLSGNSSSWLNNYNVFDYSNVTFGSATIALINQSGLINPSQQALGIMSNTSWPIYVTGQYQLVMHLKGPFEWLPGTLLTYGGLIYDAQYVLDHGGFGTAAAPNTNFNLAPIPGTGPYVVTGAKENAYAQFSQNPKYWAATLTPQQIAMQPLFDPGHVKNVIIYAKTDDLARYTDLSTGAVQIADIEPSNWNVVANNPAYSHVTLPPWSGFISTLGLNTQIYPTNITLVRQAIVHAINYTDLYKKAYGGNMTPFVGPEYPAWKQFYNLGNFTPYQYNLTLAQQDLKAANVTNMPPLLLRIETGCQACVDAASIVQSDLGQIGITVEVNVLPGSNYLSVYGGYSYNLQNAQAIGQLSWVDGGEGWGAFALTPADYWLAFVNNQSNWGNWAIYSNPVVQKCVDAFTSTNNVSQIQSLCTAAQAQIYNDAPYAWVGLFSLPLPPGGSTVWNNKIVKGFLLDPTWGGQTTTPFFNTVTFVSG